MKRLLFSIIFFLLVKTSVAQTPITFSKLTISNNTDSLLSVLKKPGMGKPERLKNLLILERSYAILRESRVGTHTSEIEVLLKQVNEPILAAYYNFNKALNKHRSDFVNTSYLGLMKTTLEIFERYKDTAAILDFYRGVMDAQLARNGEIIGDSIIAVRYFNNYNKLFGFYKNASYYDTLNFYLLNQRYYLSMINNNVPKYEEYLEKSIAFIKQHKELRYASIDVELGKANIYRNKKDFANAAKVLLGVLPKIDTSQIKKLISVNLKIAICYTELNDFKHMKKHIEYAYNNYFGRQINLPDLEVVICENYLDYVVNTSKDPNKIIELTHKLTIAFKNQFSSRNAAKMMELQTKFDYDKKQNELDKVSLQKKLIESKNKTLWVGLFSLVLVIIVVGFLAVRLRRTNLKLNILTKQQDEMFTIIAHDLSSPMKTYYSWAEIMKYLINEKQYDKLNDIASKVDETGAKVGLMLNNLLQWSLINQDSSTTKKEEVSITNLVTEVLPIYKNLAVLKSATIVENIQDTLLKTSKKHLQLIIRNLLDNAAKNVIKNDTIFFNGHIEKSYYKITIENKVTNFDSIVFSKIKALFEGSKNYHLGEDGLGLGLVMVKQFATKIGAEISIELKGEIVCFTLQLPINS